MGVSINKENKGIIVAGMNSSGGKTLVTCLLLSALGRRNVRVQPFKIGPDFIDPGYHCHFSSKNSLNLDPWIMGRELIVKEAEKFTENAFGLAEGVMGLFDGSEKGNDNGSSMEVSRWLGWKILLVVPCKNAGRSITASIRGFISEAGGAKHFVGIILNQTNSISHGEYLFQVCASLEIPILGALPEISEIRWPERHLGLKPMSELKFADKKGFAEIAEKHINIDLIVKKFSLKKESSIFSEYSSRKFSKFIKRIAVAQDAAFHFYYAANLLWLRERCVEIVNFSPLHDNQVPENVDGIILGGGFPEVFAEELSLNKKMLNSIKKTVESKIPCYAECGGLMVLSEGLKLQSGKCLPMVGVVPGIVELTKQLQHFGYCKIDLPKFGEVRGHEFHYSSWLEEEQKANLWSVTRHSTGKNRNEGYSLPNLHASYVHIYFPQAPSLISDFFGLTR